MSAPATGQRQSNSIPSASTAISKAIRNAIADPGELDRIREERDCLKAFREKVTTAGLLDHADLDLIDAETMALIEEATTEAQAAAPPDPSAVTTDVYVAY